jgi:predicted N-formylglutamate amidohydrolase
MPLVLSCEHGGRQIPAPYRPLFVGAERVLESHRGWDPGALSVASRVARRTGAPLHAVKVSRLLVDTNRSPGHPRVFSTYTRDLSLETRRELLARYHAPHHEAVAREVAALGRGGAVFHLSVHSFTPVLDGVRREVDLGVLYDPRRGYEKALAMALKGALERRLPALRVRRNAPYRGVSDGLTKVLRGRFPDPGYAGLELEVSQRFLVEPPGIAALGRAIAEAVVEVIALP